MKPLLNKKIIQVTIFKEKNNNLPKYNMYFLCKKGNNNIEKLHLLSAEKKIINKSPYYYIYTNKNLDKNSVIGKLKSSFTGTQFSLYNKNQSGNNDLKEELAYINYEKNLLPLKAPRKMVMIFPKFEKGEYKKFFPINVY